MISSLKFQQMQAAGASSGGVTFGAGQQQFNPQNTEEKNIFAVGGENSSVNGLSGVNSGSTSAVNKAVRPNEDTGLVGRLDRMDAATIKPQYQDQFRANKLDLYA